MRVVTIISTGIASGVSIIVYSVHVDFVFQSILAVYFFEAPQLDLVLRNHLLGIADFLQFSLLVLFQVEVLLSPLFSSFL